MFRSISGMFLDRKRSAKGLRFKVTCVGSEYA
jgi:hypothetical protein